MSTSSISPFSSLESSGRLAAGPASAAVVLPVQFAPLQGYTDAVYRRAHAEVFGAVEAYYTPFVRYEKGGLRNKDVKDIAPERNRGMRVIPQLIAATPAELEAIAGCFERAGYREADLNLGCPFPMQARMRRGAGLLPHPAEAAALLQAIRAFPRFSFSVKLRLGWERNDEAFALLPFLNALPLRQITLHPRLGIQQYTGKTEGESFARFLAGCRHPLFYNGDLTSQEEMQAVVSSFPGVAGLMVGRGLLASPWLAWEYRAGKRMEGYEKRERLQAFHRLLAEGYAACLEGGERQVMDKLKTVWDYLLPAAEKKLRKKVVKSSRLSDYHAAVKELIRSVDRE